MFETHTHSHGMSTLTRIAYILALIGAILLIIFGLLIVIGSPFLAYSPIYALGGIVQVLWKLFLESYA